MPEIKSQFFNGKTYSATDFVESNKNTMKDGILPNTEYFKVAPSSNMTIGVTSGRGWVQGHAFSSDSTLAFTLESADGVLDRIDTVVIRLDLTTDNEKIECRVIKGALGGSAAAPVRDGTYYDLVIAQIAVAHGTTAITAAIITDKRGDGNLCGWSGVISSDQFNFASKADKDVLYQDYLYQNFVEFEQSGVWVCPDGVTNITAIITNGGSGSPGASACFKYNSATNENNTTAVVCNSERGCQSIVQNIKVVPGQSYPLVIGAGGSGGTLPGNASSTTGYLVTPATAGGESTAFGYTGTSNGGTQKAGSYNIMYNVGLVSSSNYVANVFPEANTPRPTYYETTDFDYKFKNPKKRVRKETAAWPYAISTVQENNYRISHAGYNGYSGKVIIYY